MARLVHRAQAPDQRFRVRAEIEDRGFSGQYLGTCSPCPTQHHADGRRARGHSDPGLEVGDGVLQCLDNEVVGGELVCPEACRRGGRRRRRGKASQGVRDPDRLHAPVHTVDGCRTGPAPAPRKTVPQAERPREGVPDRPAPGAARRRHEWTLRTERPRSTTDVHCSGASTTPSGPSSSGSTLPRLRRVGSA